MKRTMLCAAAMSVLTAFLPLAANAAAVPDAAAALSGDDGSLWERVSSYGFGNTDNVGIVALYPYRDQLYALVRNDSTGFELWRTAGTSWEKVSVPGFTDGVLHDRMNTGYGCMIEFDGRLYVGVDSRFEGAYLYGSVGLAIWRYDGETWEPVIANSRDEDESGTISSIIGCMAEDSETTAQFTDETKSWETDQWAGGVLRIESGPGRGRLFDIISNTENTLTVQQNEAANMDEFTVCEAFIPHEDRPELVAGTVSAGDLYAIGMGTDENGFGEIWNKNIIDFEVLDGELYASIAHNYEDGTRVWKTADGMNWEPTSPYSFGLFHGYTPEGDETGFCLIEGLEDRNGAPVCSSSTYFGKSAVSGTETLYVGGTGSSGCNGRGARVLRYDNGTWRFIVDYFVDDNDQGTNESGFGDADSFFSSNFQAWSWAQYDERLFVGIARMKGCRIMYTDSGSAQDGAWTYAVGGDAAMPDGFDGVSNFVGYGSNLVPLLYTYKSQLFAATMANAYSLPLFAGHLMDGGDIWRATGPAGSLVWTRVTGSGFGDKTISFQGFCEFGGQLYAAGSNLFGNFTGDKPEGSQGCAVYRLEQLPGMIVPASFTAKSSGIAISLSWQVDNETGVSGYNVHRSASEEENKPYRQVNRTMIAADGGPSESTDYTYTDKPVWFNRTYFYKIEAVGEDGSSQWFGPLGVTTVKLLGN